MKIGYCGKNFPNTELQRIKRLIADNLFNVRRHVVGSGRRRNLLQMRPIEPIRLIVRGPGGKEILTTGDVIARRTRHTLNGTGNTVYSDRSSCNARHAQHQRKKE